MNEQFYRNRLLSRALLAQENRTKEIHANIIQSILNYNPLHSEKMSIKSGYRTCFEKNWTICKPIYLFSLHRVLHSLGPIHKNPVTRLGFRDEFCHLFILGMRNSSPEPREWRKSSLGWPRKKNQKSKTKMAAQHNDYKFIFIVLATIVALLAPVTWVILLIRIRLKWKYTQGKIVAFWPICFV